MIHPSAGILGCYTAVLPQDHPIGVLVISYDERLEL